MLNEIDTVALLVDRPDAELSRGEIGTVVCVHGPDAFEVEFVALDGWTYAMQLFRREELLKLLPHRQIAEPDVPETADAPSNAKATGLARLWPFKR